MNSTTYTYRNNEWIEAEPNEGERYKIVVDKGDKGQRIVEGVKNTPVEDKRITRLAFISRFTDEEYVGIDMASLDDVSADIATRANAAKIRLYLNKVNAATFIDLSLPETVSAINTLVGAGLVSSVRAHEILNSPIKESERFNG